ncbi:hypothetical protein KIPB_009059 [Kipferlia bialata]|uniref:Uncharacterized protein n=1 Tax=Kipferlia bialata TaxID=797122 RepID=A0A9K3GKC3_9EUKA|nr:hypothetical protein KIPB_009059 [Kipferlia bialata]|eukprot:g9059.t1
MEWVSPRRVHVYFTRVYPASLIGFAAMLCVMVYLYNIGRSDSDKFNWMFNFISDLGNPSRYPYYWVFTVTFVALACVFMVFPTCIQEAMVLNGMYTREETGKGTRLHRQKHYLRAGSVGVALVGVCHGGSQHVLVSIGPVTLLEGGLHTMGLGIFLLTHIWLCNYTYQSQALRVLGERCRRERGTDKACREGERETVCVSDDCVVEVPLGPSPLSNNPIKGCLEESRDSEEERDFSFSMPRLVLGRVVQNFQLILIGVAVIMSLVFGPRLNCGLGSSCADHPLVSGPTYEWILAVGTLCQLGTLYRYVTLCGTAICVQSDYLAIESGLGEVGGDVSQEREVEGDDAKLDTPLSEGVSLGVNVGVEGLGDPNSTTKRDIEGERESTGETGVSLAMSILERRETRW